MIDIISWECLDLIVLYLDIKDVLNIKQLNKRTIEMIHDIMTRYCY